MIQQSYQDWTGKLAQTRFPRWKELPTLGLYIDQVVTIVNDQLSAIGVEPLTKSMVNNYVKKKVIQAPVKKKYAVNQLVDLLLIGLFKTSFSIEEIRVGIAEVTVAAYPQKAYDQFVDILNAKLAGEPLQPLANYQPSQQLEIYAIDAVLTQLKATHLLRELHQQQSVTQVD